MKTRKELSHITKRQIIRKSLYVISFLTFSLTAFYFSPFFIVLGAMEGIIGGSLIIFSVMFVLSIFFGRIICGYACPVGGVQECLMLANNESAKGGWRNFIKYFIWTPWVIVIIMLFIYAGGVSDVVFNIHFSLSIEPNRLFIMYVAVLLFVVITAMVMGKRAFCHYICWMAPFMVIGSKISDGLKLPKLRLMSNKEHCAGCSRCSNKCPMSLDVKEMIENDHLKNVECILCGECIDTCPKKAISYSIKRS